ncbi:UNVERIFIED_CONTAM: hypothetical protein K2H54_053203, partial [Gekko kuhli]
MAFREEDGFLLLQEPETPGLQHSGTAETAAQGTAAEELKRGAAKRPPTEASGERNGAAAPKRAKKSARKVKQPGKLAATAEERQGRKQQDGNGRHGPNPQTYRPDATSYSGAETTRPDATGYSGAEGAGHDQDSAA